MQPGLHAVARARRPVFQAHHAAAAAAHRWPYAAALSLSAALQDTVGKPIQCKAAIAWEAKKPLEVGRGPTGIGADGVSPSVFCGLAFCRNIMHHERPGRHTSRDLLLLLAGVYSSPIACVHPLPGHRCDSGSPTGDGRGVLARGARRQLLLRLAAAAGAAAAVAAAVLLLLLQLLLMTMVMLPLPLSAASGGTAS